MRAAGAGAQLTQIARDAKAEDLAARQAELRRLERQIAIGMQHTRFDASDLAQAQRRLKDAIAALGQDRDRPGRQLQERIRLRDAARARGGKGFRRHAGASDGRREAARRAGLGGHASQRKRDRLRPAAPGRWHGADVGATPCPVRIPPIRRSGARPLSACGRRSIRYRHGASTSTSW